MELTSFIQEETLQVLEEVDPRVRTMTTQYFTAKN
jgi:hypothetical protein